MKIIHIISGLGVGGAESTLNNLIKHSRSDGSSHIVISLSSLDSLADSMRAAGAEVRFLGLRRNFANPRLFCRLVRWIVELRPDVVQTWMYHADFVGGLAARTARIVFWARRISRTFVIAWGIHRTEVPTSHSLILRSLAWLCARLSRFMPDLTVCCAEAAYRSHTEYGYDKSRMEVIRNGFDTERFAPNPAAHMQLTSLVGIPDQTTVIGIVGRFNPAKDFDNFLRAASLLAGRAPDCHFVMIGKDLSPTNPALSAYVNLPELADRLHLLGVRNDIQTLMPGFDTLCLSSRTEGLPTVVGEAMSCGVPCVVTNVGDTAALVGETGLVVPPADHLALADALERMVKMPKCKRGRLGQEARARILANFSIEACWGAYSRAYARTLRGKPRAQGTRNRGEA